MSRLGRAQPIQPRIITPAQAPGTAIIADGRILAAGKKNGTGSAVIVTDGTLSPAGGGHTGTGGASIQGTGVLSPVPAPLALRNAWTASYTAPLQPAGVPLPGPASIPVAVANVAGNWLFAVAAWRQAPGYPPVTFSVGDGTNRWEPMGAPGGTSTAAGSVRVAVWRAPAARAVSVVSAAPTGFVLSACVAIIEPAGLLPWITEAGTLTVFTGSVTSLPALTPPVSAVPVFWLTACVRSLSSPTGIYPSSGAVVPFSGVPGEASPGQAAPGSPAVPTTSSSTGNWTPGPAAATGNGVDHTGDLVLLTAWQQSQGSVSASWAQTAASDMAAIVTGVLVSAPAPVQPNPAWAAGTFEVAPGAGPGTPADQITWVPVDGTAGVPARMQDLTFSQGQQYTVGALQSGQGSVTLDNRDLALTPPGSSAFAGMDSGIPWRYRAVWAGGGNYPVNVSPHYVLQGFTVNLPSTWNQNRRGVITTGLTDAWAYCQPQVKSALREEMLADNPTHLWPCSDSAGVAYASNLATGSAAALVQVNSKYGPAGAAAAFGASAALSPAQAAISPATSGSLPGGGGSVWAQTGLPAAPTSGGYCLYCQDSGFPALNGPNGMSVECWSALTDPVLQQNATLWAIKGSKGVIMRLWADPTGTLWLTLGSLSGALATTSLGTTSYIGAGLFQTVVTWTAGTGWTAYVNGAQVTTVATAAVLPPAFSWITAGGEADKFFTGNMFNGQTCFLGTFPTALPPSRVASHWQAGSAAFAGEADHSRVERLLTYAGYSGKRVIKRQALPDLTASLADLGASSASSSAGGGAPTPAGISTVQAGQQITALIASITPGMLYVAPTGDIVYQPKGLQFGQPAVWVLNDTGANGGIPYLPDVNFGWDPQRVLNDVQITQVDRQDVVIPQGFVPSSAAYNAPGATRAKYGQDTYQINGYLYNDLTTPLSVTNPSGLIDLANWVSVTLATPHLRAGRITVDASTYPAAWPLVLGAAPGDVALVGRAPITASTSIALLARIMRVERRIAFLQGSTVATAALTLDYAPELVPLILDDPVAGVLDGTRVLAW